MQRKLIFAALVLIAPLIFTIFAPIVSAASNLNIYDDSLSSGWVNWSWGSNVNFSNANPVASGSKSIAWTPYAWGGIYLHTDSAADKTQFDNFSFKLYVTSNNQKFSIIFYDFQNQKISGQPLESPVVNNWKQYNIPTSSIGSNQIKGFAIQEVSGQNQPTVYIDNIVFNTPQAAPSASSDIFIDSLTNGWINWSWGSNIDFNSTNSVSGKSIAFSPYAGWAGLYLHTDGGFNTTNFGYLNFSAKSSQNNQKFQVGLYDQNNNSLGALKALSNYGGDLSASIWKSYSIPLTDLNASNKLVKGIVIQDATGNWQPTVFIDNLKFVSQNTSPVPTPTQTPVPSPTGSCPVNNSCCSQPIQKCSASGKDTSCPSGYQWCYGGYCVNENYNPSTNSCPGVQPAPTSTPIPTPTPVPSSTPNTTVGGYTASSNKIFQNGTSIKLKGISWFGFETGTYSPHGLWARNWKEMISQMKNLGFNSVRVPVCPAVLKGIAANSIDYAKNPDLNGLNSLQVLDKILNEMNAQGMYILLDHHRPDCNAISPLWYTGSYSETDWINDLKFMAARYKNLPYFMGLDIKNEPHGNATWGTGNTSTDWNLAAERAGKEVLAVNPNILIFVQGIQENPTCSSNIAHWMGGNLEPIDCKPISNSFIPANKLILSPHVYGPDVYNQGYFNDENFPNNLSAIWEKHFGRFVDKDFTIVPGEWGGKYGNGGDPKDKIWQDAFVNYMKSKRICNSYYWDWNPNSGDTGGILKDDWTSIWDNKMNMLKDYFNTCN